jgi:hypothetical protein
MKAKAHAVAELFGAVLALGGMICVGAILQQQSAFVGIDLPQYALGFSFLGFLLWSIGRSGAR